MHLAIALEQPEREVLHSLSNFLQTVNPVKLYMIHTIRDC